MQSFWNQLFIFGANDLYIVIVAVAGIYFLMQPTKTKKQMIVFGIISLPLTYIVAKICSTLYYDPRPFIAEHFIPLIPHAADNGFPSDHTLISAAITAVIYQFHKKTAIFLAACTIIVGVSRVYVGVHHPIDILGSIVIATIISAILFPHIKKLKYFAA